MPSLQFDVTALDRASRAFTQIADRIDMLVARLAALNGATATANVDVDTDPADRTLGRWEQTFRRRVRDALATIPTDIELRVDATDVEVELGRIRRELAELTTKRVGIDITAEDAIIQIRDLKAQLAELDASDADIQVRADVASALAALEAVLEEARRIDGQEPTIRPKVDNNSLKDLANAAALFQRSIQQLFTGPGLVLLIPGVVSLAADLENLLGLLGLIPGLLAGGAAAFAALTIGMNGFGTALKAIGDPQKFAEAIKALAPNARDAAKALNDMHAAFAKIQTVTQNALFRNMAADIKAFQATLPTIQGGLQGIAGSINVVVTTWAKWAAQQQQTQALGVIFENTRAAIQDLAPGIQAVAQALTDMAVVGAKMLPELARGFTDVAGKFRDWIGQITSNGQFEAWIRGAIDVFNQLVDIVGNTLGGLEGLFSAIEAAGPSALDVIQNLAKAFNDWANSADGQAKLIAFFQALNDINAQVGPAIAGIFATIAATIVTAGPAIAGVAESFKTLVGALGPGVVILGGFLSALTPITTGFVALVNALGPLPGLVLGAFLVFKTSGAILAGFSAVVLAIVPLVERLGLALIGLGSSAGIGGALAATGAALGTVGTALRGVAAFLTGPWGFAILGAIALLALLSGGEDTAAAAAQRHEEAVKRLQGTLDQTNGSITEATKQQIAMDLAMEKLATTGQTVATGLAKNGIAFSDYAAAASGSEVALKKVNAELLAVGESQIKSTGAWEASSASLQKAGISLDLLTASALGNVQAQQQMADALLPTSKNMTAAQNRAQELTDQFRGQLDPALVELAMKLGDTSGALKDASAATQLAADATADWGASLQETKGALQEFGNLINANGSWDAAAAGAQNLAESFQNLGDAAQATARNAGREAQAMGASIQAAGAAAAASVAQSRAEFLKLADSLHIPAVAARELADEMGLIPTAVELNFETNADETQQQINEIAARIQATPDKKEIHVLALTDDAIKRLDAVGIDVEKLKDGTFVLHLDDAEFQAKLKGALGAADGLLKPFIAFLDLDTAQADAKLNDFKTRGGAGNVAIPISFEHSLADQQLNTLQTQAKVPQVMPLQMDIAQAQAMLQALQAQAKQLQTMPLTADPSQALGVLGALVGTITGTTATMTIAAQNGPALATLGATVGAVNGTTGTMTIAAQNGPALGTLGATKAAVDRTIGTMTIAGNAGPALAAARAAVGAINAMKATITVTTNEIHNVTRNIKDVAASGGLMQFAQGGIVPGFAPGKDRIPALLSPGEAVLVPEAVRLLGQRAVVGLNRLASGGRHMAMVGANGARTYRSFATAGGRAGNGAAGDGMASGGKTYVLNVYNAGNNEIDLREQFRKMEVLGV